MKIVLVTETFPPEVNGVAMTLHRVVTGLQKFGHELMVVRPRQKADTQSKLSPANEERSYAELLVRGLPIPRYPGLQFGLPTAGILQRTWKTFEPDLVHIATEGPLGKSALGAARKMGLPISSSFHTNFHSYGKHYGYNIVQGPLMRFFRGFHNATSATFVPSDTVLKELETAGFKNVKILARGVDTELFGPHRRSEEMRKTWGAGPETPVAIYVGRVASEKNIPLTVKAFLKFREKEPEAKLVIVGDGPERKKLEKQHPEIIFAGMRRGEDLATHYASADFFFFASTSETFGNVVTEGMASGLIVLTYDYAAGQRHVTDGENGFLARYDDEQAFLEGIETIHNAKDVWPAIRQAARETTIPISWESILRGFESDLKAIVSKG